MSKWVKDHQKILIILFFPYLFVLLLLIAPTKFSLTAPGGLTPVYENIEIESVDIKKNFYTIYVVSYYPMTPFQKMISDVSERISVREMTERDEDTSWRDVYLQGQLTKEVSLHTSIIKAYELAHLRNPEIMIDYEYLGASVYYRPSRISELEIGDLVISVNNQSLTSMTYQMFYDYFYQQTSVTLEIARHEENEIKYFTIDYVKQMDEPWMLFYPKYDVISSYPTFDFTQNNPLIGGPSGGMIQTLSIYASLLNINLGDLKIAGTGTIEIDGSIGRIGGILQKLYTAIDAEADIFIYPKGHISDIPDMEYPYEMIAVGTIEEAVTWLHEKVE